MCPNKRLPKYPDFADLIDDNRIYVDKTDLLAKFVGDPGPFFIVRPRRFGKSTLVSTLYELFAHGLTRFQGLKFEKAYEEKMLRETGVSTPWSNQTYKVIRLDFSSCKKFYTFEKFQSSFLDLLTEQLDEANIAYDVNISAPVELFSDVLDDAQVKGEQYVLLIDEYDAPFTASFDKPALFAKVREMLSLFYARIKSRSKSLRFTFITGICYYAHVSMFSGFNAVTDLTLDSKYGALLGYTQEELESYFSHYLDNAVEVLNAKYAEQNLKHTYTRAQLLADLKQNYDGYSFDEECQYHVYNPWSIIKFLESPHRKFQTYWFDTGGFMPTLLVKYIENTVEATQQEHYDLNLLLDLDTTYNKTSEDLLPKAENLSTINPFAILYQAGYFTIKKKFSTNSF